MAQNQPPEKTDESPLARRIRQELRKRHMTQKDLSVLSGLEEVRISRILHDNDVTITDYDLDQLTMGLDLKTEGRNELTYLAYPKKIYHDEAIRRGENHIEMMCRLADEGIDLSKIR